MLLIEAPSKKKQETKLDDRGLGDTSLCTSSDFKHRNLCRTRKGESSEEGVGKKKYSFGKMGRQWEFSFPGTECVAYNPK